jgi:hypothetical protein
MKLMNIFKNNFDDKLNEAPGKMKESNGAALRKANKLITYLVKYYGLKVNNVRQIIADISRFL